MDISALFLRLGIAVAIGFLVGLERAKAGNLDDDDDIEDKTFGGTRTFSLLGLTGGLGQC
jgi:hypothetical protein